MAAFVRSNQPTMKHPALLPLLVIGIAIFTTNAHGQQPPAPSADPAPAARPKPEALTPPVADPTADPFTRDGKKAAPAPQPEEVAPVNIYALLEYIEVPRDQWFAWSAANPLHGDASALRNEVQKWIAAGQAKPIELACLPTKSGMRTAIESVVERRYPNAFLPGTPTPLPTTFETRATHFTFEWEPVRGPDLVIDSNFIPQLISFCGDEQWTPGARKTAQPGDGGQPRLAVNKATLSMSAAPHQPMLVQVTTPVDEAGKPRDGARLLLFFRAAPVAASPAPKPASPASSGSDKTKTAAKKTTDAI